MTDLREQVATYFKAVHHRHEHGMGGPYCEACAGKVPADKSANDMVWFVMADHTIRIAEWARRNHTVRPPLGKLHDIKAVLACPCGSHLWNQEQTAEHWERGHFDGPSDLTLPPDGWKP